MTLTSNALHFGCKGYFTITSNLRGKLAEFPNIVTDWGLEYMATNSGYLSYLRVGRGSSTPLPTNTALDTYAGYGTVIGNTNGVAAAEPYYVFTRNFYRITGVTGNITEVGVAPQSSNTGNVFSRALILDDQNLPTTITVLSGEILDITYEFRIYAPTTDSTGTITLTGNKGMTVNWTARPVGIASYWRFSNAVNGNAGAAGDAFDSSYSGSAATSALVPITTYPNNTFSLTSFMYTYNAGSLSRTLQVSKAAGTSGLNISLLVVRFGPICFQISLSPYIGKSYDDAFSMTMQVSWGRA